MSTLTRWSDYGYLVDVLNGRDKRKLANNTYARREDDGRIVIRYHDTDILKFSPNGDVEYQSGGWLTYTTKERFNSFGAKGVRISQTKGRWYVYANGSWTGPLSDYYDGMVVNGNQLVTPARNNEDPDKKIKRDIDRYVKGYTDEVLAELVETDGKGDCWYCQMRVVGTDGVALGDHTGNTDHLLSHIEENYRMINLAYNAVKAAGYGHPAVILRYGDMTRKAIKRYLRQRLAPNTAGAAGGPKPIAQGF